MATFTVTNLGDSGTGSLRDAIVDADAADAAGGTSTIAFDPNLKGGTLTLTSGELDITASGITIDGEIDGTDIAIDGNRAGRVFSVDGGTATHTISATLSGLVIQNGYGGGKNGGGIYVGASDVLALTNSVVSGNGTVGNGGGIYGAANAIIALNDVTLSGNEVAFDGGGIYGSGALIGLTNCTVYGNFSDSEGGGIFAGPQSLVTLTNTTVSGNSAIAGGGIFDAGSYTRLTNSIVAGNLGSGGGDDLVGGSVAGNYYSLTFTGGNIIGSATLGFATVSGPPPVLIDGTSPSALGTVFASVGTDHYTNVLSGALANNGGPVETIALKASALNPAIDAGNDALAPATDARGFARSDFPGVAHNGANISDLGAYEAQTPTNLIVTTLSDETYDGGSYAQEKNDGNGLSLREAIGLADAAGGSHTITIASNLAGGTLTLISGELDITSNITIDGDIDGNSTPDITIDGGGNSRVFDVSSGSSTLDGLVITDGMASGSEGGGIYNLGTLTLANSTVSDSNSSEDGGGIANLGILTLTNSTLAFDFAQLGGGIANLGSLTAISSTLSGNGAAESGAAIDNAGGGLATLINSTLFDNSSHEDGGGIENYGVATLINDTLSANGTFLNGGAIDNLAGGTLTLTDSTLSGNAAGNDGGGIYDAGTLTLTNSIVAGNGAGVTPTAQDLAGSSPPVTVTLDGQNILGSVPSNVMFDTSNGGYNGIDGNNATALASVFAKVGRPLDTGVLSGLLADNGGPVETIALNPTGIAIDAGVTADLPPDTYDLNHNNNTTEPLPVDARGYARVSGPAVDLGAMEVQMAPTPTNLVVTTLADEQYNGGDYAAEKADGAGLSLREAIGLADAAGGSHTITFAQNLAGGTLTLTSGALNITGNITIDGDIDGNGTPDITIDGNHASPVFGIYSGNGSSVAATLHGLVIEDGLADGPHMGSDGGGIYVGRGDALTLSNAAVTGNYANSDGGGIYAASGASLTLSNDVIASNQTNGDGGGVFGGDGSTVTLTGSSVDGNSVNPEGGRGGGVYDGYKASLTLTNSAVTGNDAAAGGGIYGGYQASLTLTNSTVSENGAGTGGGIFGGNDASIDLTGTTLAYNSAGGAGGGVFGGDGATIALTNATLAGNYAHSSGGGVYGVENDAITLTNSTLTGNDAGATGGGIYNWDNAGSTTLVNSIVAGNDAAAGGSDLDGGATPSSLTLTGGNILGSAPSSFSSVNGSYTPIDGTSQTGLQSVFANVGYTRVGFAHTRVLSGQLGYNGGPVQTIALNPTGIAIDTGVTADAVYGTPSAPIATDARGAGFARVVGASVDIGAFEQQAAQSFVVTTSTDELDSTNPNATLADMGGAGDLSLREALFLANEDPTTADTITFAANLAGDTIDLTLGQLKIDGGVTIDGGTDNITIDAQGHSRVFDARYGTSTINGLTMTGGSALGYAAGDGGAIQVGTLGVYGGADLTISNSTITDSQAAYGGGIAVNVGDSLQLTNSTVSGNSAYLVGGGIANQGTLTLTNSTVESNYSGYIGGGIASDNTLTVIGSTLSDNQISGLGAGVFRPGYSYGGGGGLYNSGSATLLNTTIAGNKSSGYAGGGIYNSEALTLTNVTIADNSADDGGGLSNAACGCGNVAIYDTTITGNDATNLGGGIYNANGIVALTNSIVAGNGASQGPDIATYAAGGATTIYSGVNLFSQAGAGRAGTDIDVSPADLSQVFATGTLANNGGPVKTVLIAQGGLAEDAGDAGALPPDTDDLNNNGNTAEPLPVDARGDPRVVDGTLDLGAVELQVPRPVISNPDTVIAVAGTGPIALDIAAPTDSDGSTPTITLDTVPTYGITQYFNGSTFVTATAGAMLTPAELASLDYTPPPSGEFGGQTISYSATDNGALRQGSIAVTVLVDDTGPSNLYFTAFAGPGNGGNPDLYTLDQNGNPLAIPMSSPNGSTAGEDGGFIQYAGNLYFNAFNPTTSDALYVLTPGSTTPTPVLDTNGNIVDHAEQIASNFTEFDGSLYFVDLSTTGVGLFRLDADGVATPINLNSNAFDQFLDNGFADFDNALYFAAYTGAPNDSSVFELVPGSNTPIDADPGNLTSFDGEDGGFYVFNNALYFNAFSKVLGEDTLLELKAGSTTPVPVDSSGTVLSHEFEVPSAFHEFDGSLYFNELSNADSNDTLFKLDADGTLTPLEYQNQPLVNAGEFDGFADFAGSTYFAADLSGVTTLFKLDASGTISPIFDAGGMGAFDANLESGFVVFADNLYFDAYNSVGGDSLYQLSANGTLTTIDLGNNPGATTDAGVDGGFQIVGNNLYFSAFTPNGYELVALAADGTVTEFDINPGAGNNSFDTGGGSPANALGAFPQNIINGTPGNDILAGSTPDEIINGGAGNDILEGRGGNDILTGGDGADTFQFSLAGPANVDTVTDYSLAQGDVLDVSPLIDTNFIAGSQIVDFVRLIASGNDLILQVDPNGSGDDPHVWQNVADLQNANTAPVNQVTGFFAGTDHTITQTTDFTAPIVQSVVFSAPAGTLGQGALVTVTVDMSEAVMVETAFGSPTLGLNDGGVATFDAADSTPTALVFDYTVLTGQNTAALATSASGVSLNGGTIEDLSANEADLTASDNVSAVPTIEVDTRQPPTIAGAVAGQITTAEAPVTPFSGVTITDPNSRATDMLTITLSSTNSRFGTLSGTGLTGSGATFQLVGTAAAITAELDVLSFTPVNGVPGTSVTTTFDLSDQSSAFPTATTNDTTSVIDIDLAIPPTPVINFPHVIPTNVDEWILADGQWAASAQPGPIPSGYEVAGTGDFTGNGTSDILWQNPSTGDTQEWLINNGAWAGTVDLGVHPGNYQIAGVGDFFGSGIDDALWASTSPNGQVQTDIWELNSSGQWQESVQPGPHPAGYNVVGVGDFTGNGTSDILWQNPTTGDVDEWQIANGQWSASVDLGSHPGAGWTIAGVGDFFDNGRDDILWTNSTNGPNGNIQVDIWELGTNGQWIASVTPGLGIHPPGYQVAAIGNFTGSGTDGVLWYDPANGNVDEWVLDNHGQWAASVDLGTHPGNFQIAGTGSFVNGNPTSDILWQSHA